MTVEETEKILEAIEECKRSIENSFDKFISNIEKLDYE